MKFSVCITFLLLVISSVSCKKTSDGETVAPWNKIYIVEITKFEKDWYSGRLVEKKDSKEIVASNDEDAAREGFIWYLASIKTFSKLNESSNGNWLTIPKFYSVYDENKHLIPRIKGEEKQKLIKTALTEEDIKAYKDNLPPYHFEFSALIAD